MKPLLLANGIVHETSAPRTPQQNGKSERFNRTLMEMTRALLYDSNVPTNCWDYALEHAAFLLNHLPGQDGESPYKKITKKERDIKSIPKFGSVVYVKHLQRITKMETRSTKCYFLGYEPHSKAIRALNLSNGRFVYSREYIFQEL